MSKVLRASEIGEYLFCPYLLQLRIKGIPTQQTLQDLITENRIPPNVIRQLQQKNIPLNTTIDKVLGQGLLPPKVEKEIIKQNILLQGDLLHEKRGMTTKQNAMIQEHRGLWILVLLIIMVIIGFLVLLMVRGYTP